MPWKQNAIFNELIFKKLTNVQLHYVGISYTKFHPNWPRYIESISKNSTGPIRKL